VRVADSTGRARAEVRAADSTGHAKAEARAAGTAGRAKAEAVAMAADPGRDVEEIAVGSAGVVRVAGGTTGRCPAQSMSAPAAATIASPAPRREALEEAGRVLSRRSIHPNHPATTSRLFCRASRSRNTRTVCPEEAPAWPDPWLREQFQPVLNRLRWRKSRPRKKSAQGPRQFRTRRAR